MKQKWQTISQKLEELDSQTQEVFSQDEVLNFETYSGWFLPRQYKNFCQVFGSVIFGDYIEIYCSSIKDSRFWVQALKLALKHSIRMGYFINNNVDSIEGLLNSAFIFGHNSFAEVVFWDLRTYSEVDSSYDIYLARVEDFDGVYRVGRDFFEFVCDFCLGMKSHEVLPEYMRPRVRELHPTFTRFSRPEVPLEIEALVGAIQNQQAVSSASKMIPEEKTQDKIKRLWQQNVASGVVLKMALAYERQSQLIEALVLYIIYFEATFHSGIELVRLLKAFKRLYKVMGEAQFRQICQATTGSAETYKLLLAQMRDRELNNLNITVENERYANFYAYRASLETLRAVETTEFEDEQPENLDDILVEPTPEPDAEFQQVWQAFLQSIYDRLAAGFPSDESEPNVDENTYEPESNVDGTTYYEDFEHLHLPSEYAYTAPELPNNIDELESEEIKQALRENNPYALFRYLRTLKNHIAPVYCVTFSPDGKTLVSGSADATIKLWDLNTRQEIATFTGHTNAVICVAISPDGKTLVSGSADATIKLWDLNTRQEIDTFTGHTNAVICVAISPDGKTLASGSADATIKLWDLNTRQEIHTLTNHADSVLSIAISPDGKTLASGSADTTIKLWDLRTGKEIQTLDENSGFVFAVCFHPNGQMLASTHGVADAEGIINLWNLSSREIIRTIITDEVVSCVTISPDGQIVAGGSGSSFTAIGLWSLGTGKFITTFPSNVGSIYHMGLVYSVAFSPDGQMLASGGRDTTIKLWGIPPPLEI